jgi:hypothetical protein
LAENEAIEGFVAAAQLFVENRRLLRGRHRASAAWRLARTDSTRSRIRGVCGAVRRTSPT